MSKPMPKRKPKAKPIATEPDYRRVMVRTVGEAVEISFTGNLSPNVARTLADSLQSHADRAEHSVDASGKAGSLGRPVRVKFVEVKP